MESGATTLSRRPGWSLDQEAIDSGVSVGNPVATDGTGTAWLDSDDGVLWQLTDYTIQEGDVIKEKLGGKVVRPVNYDIKILYYGTAVFRS